MLLPEAALVRVALSLPFFQLAAILENIEDDEEDDDGALLC